MPSNGTPSGACEWLTTGAAAQLLGTSRQHVVNLCARGVLPYSTSGTHRRIRRADLEAFLRGCDRLDRPARRNLWLHHAVAGRVVTRPDSAMGKARESLRRLIAEHPRGRVRRRLRGREALLDGPLDEILAVLTSASPEAVELRQNSPFAGVLDEQERAATLAAFRSRCDRAA